MRGALIAAAAAALVTLAGCGSEPPAEPPDTTSETTAEAPGGHGSLAQCLREHGVPAAPGPTAGPPPGIDPATWQQAMAACSSLAPGPAG